MKHVVFTLDIKTSVTEFEVLSFMAIIQKYKY